MARDAVIADQAQAALRAQATRDARLAIADDVIVNAGHPAELRAQVDALHEQVLSTLAASASRAARTR